AVAKCRSAQTVKGGVSAFTVAVTPTFFLTFRPASATHPHRAYRPRIGLIEQRMARQQWVDGKAEFGLTRNRIHWSRGWLLRGSLRFPPRPRNKTSLSIQSCRPHDQGIVHNCFPPNGVPPQRYGLSTPRRLISWAPGPITAARWRDQSG